MNPNDTNPSNTPLAGDVPPAPEAPVSPFTAAPVETPAPDTTPAAIAPVFATTPETPQAPKPSNTKKIILIAAIAGGALLLAVIGFIVFTLLTSVSKAEYRDAARQFNQVTLASSSLASDARTLGYSTGSASDSTFESSVSEAEASITKLQEENEALSTMKAVRVGEGAKLYATFNDKLKAYTAYATELVTSVKNLRPAFVVCAKVSGTSGNEERASALKACAKSLSEVENVPNTQMKTYVDAIAKAYNEYASVYTGIAALTSPFGAQYEQYKTLRDKMYTVQDNISDAGDKFSDALQARDDEMSVKESANTLGDYLTDQQK